MWNVLNPEAIRKAPLVAQPSPYLIVDNLIGLEGRLLLLYNAHDLSRYAAEISPDAGRCLIFKVTPNCWHGHEPFDGERRTIQLNYVTSEEVRDRDLKRHRFSAFLKGLFSRKDAKSPAH